MQAAQVIPPGEIVASADQRVVLHVPWAHFEAILALRGDAPVPRVTYTGGTLELMSPSRTHESIKTLLARMVELYAFDADIRLCGYGSWTLRSAPKETAIEPDECYIVGDARAKDTPDLAIEVIWTSGGLDKLEVYRGLGVGEVWVWRDGAIRIHRLRGDRYEEVGASVVLPGIDTKLIGRLAGYEDQDAALRELRATVRRS